VQPSLRLGRLAGIEIGIHYTWLLIAVLITGSFFGYFSNAYAHWPLRTTWSAAIVISVLFFASIILHEMAHALVAKAYGMQVRTITLFALGGVAHIEKQAATAAAEFWMGLAGPVMSAAVGFLCGWLGSWLGASAQDGFTPVAAVLLSLSSLNLMLAMFNLIPGFPLDGGRILRATIWGLSGDENRATRIASRAGHAPLESPRAPDREWHWVSSGWDYGNSSEPRVSAVSGLDCWDGSCWTRRPPVTSRRRC
jgi:Zn-dependent protease